jgi:Arc/MetJ-type ribon-helix-helix transcriptional regulator
MIQRIPDDVQAEIDRQMASGQYPDEEAVLRDAMASLREFDENVADLQLAIDDWLAGDEGMPVDQAAELIRRDVEGPSR